MAITRGVAGAKSTPVRKSIFNLLLPLALLAGCGQPAEKAADNSKAPPREFSVQSDTNGNVVVSLSAAAQKRLGLEVAPVSAAEEPLQISAFGSVLDPAPLLALHGELTADEATSQAAEKVAQRARA